MKLVSVIIPYFKKKKYIKRSIESVISQSYKNIEVILIYDDNEKNELNFIKKLVKKDKRINLIINNKNLGAGESRNLGMKKAKGKYIAFIDSDDLWHREKLKLQINFMNKSNINFSHTSYKILNEKNKIIGERKAKDFTSIQKFAKSCDIGLSTVIIKKKILDKKLKFAKLKTKEDFVLWLRILEKNIKIYGLNKNLSYWRKTSGSLSSSIFQKLFDGYKVYNKYMKFNFFMSMYYLLCLSINYLKK